MTSPYRDYIEEVRGKTDLVKLFRDRKILPPDALQAVCPFHPDTHPSLSVNPRTQHFHCFGCGVSGDVFGFIQRMDGVGFKQAVDALAVEAGVRVIRPHQQDQQEVDWERAVSEIVEEAACYYQGSLVSDRGAEARAYLKRRGLPDDFIARFRLGWADGMLASSLVGKWGEAWGPVLVRAGLAAEARNVMSWSGPVYRDHLFDRVIFPCLRGPRATFLAGRTLGDGDPKYLGQKGVDKPLYNEEAINATRVFVVEGQIDTLSLVAWDLPAVGQLGGTTPAVIGKLQRVANVYVCLDADRAGRASTAKLAVALGPRRLRVVPFPEGLDPNDFYRTRTKSEFEDRVAKAVDPGEFLIQYAADSPEDLGVKLDPLLRFLAGLKPVDAESYLPKLQASLKLSSAMIQAARRQIEGYRDGATSCPACGTQLIRRT